MDENIESLAQEFEHLYESGTYEIPVFTLKDDPGDQHIKAAIEFLYRKWRYSHPKGHTDKAGRWYPAADESQKCCRHIRGPSRTYPWSYMTHCRSMIHIANLYNTNPSDVRKLLSKKGLPCLLGINPQIDAFIEKKLKGVT